MDVVRAVFFDSGGTLAGPIEADWWPKPRFAELLAAAGFEVPEERAVRAAHDAAFATFANRVMTTLDQEVTAYQEFYAAVLEEIVGRSPGGLVAQLAEAAVCELDQEPYEDTRPALTELSVAGLRLGVVSNAGPSLELRHRSMGLRSYFDPFVLSATVGSEKPDYAIYRHALDRAALPAEQVAFVDDVAINVKAAEQVGMRGVLIDRAGESRHPKPGTITSLAELSALL